MGRGSKAPRIFNLSTRSPCCLSPSPQQIRTSKYSLTGTEIPSSPVRLVDWCLPDLHCVLALSYFFDLCLGLRPQTVSRRPERMHSIYCTSWWRAISFPSTFTVIIIYTCSFKGSLPVSLRLRFSDATLHSVQVQFLSGNIPLMPTGFRRITRFPPSKEENIHSLLLLCGLWVMTAWVVIRLIEVFHHCRQRTVPLDPVQYVTASELFKIPFNIVLYPEWLHNHYMQCIYCVLDRR
jgi:hypothetical protein